MMFSNLSPLNIMIFAAVIGLFNVSKLQTNKMMSYDVILLKKLNFTILLKFQVKYASLHGRLH